MTFSLDVRLVESLKAALPLSVFVETGTFKGDTAADIVPFFDRLITVEFSEPLWEEAVARFKNESKVEVLLGNSPEVLARLHPTLDDTPTLFWLDAHWCVAENTAGDQSQCPLLNEIYAINRLNDTSVVLIDDARLFLAPPAKPHEIAQWPSFNKIVTALRELSAQHELMVINDVIAFYPLSAKPAMVSYAQNFGIDWLVATNSLKENGSFIRRLEEKESFIQQQQNAIQQQQSIIQQKEGVIKELASALRAYRLVFWPFRHVPVLKTILRMIRRSIEILRPRLGNLNQYAPRQLVRASLGTNVRHLTSLPKFAIVTPSFQQGEYIERTIRSILDQQYPNIEYFIQDGGSKDGTVTILKKFEDKLHGWASEEDTGQSQAINRAFAKTGGEIMAWLNSDDLLLPDTLATVASFFNRHPEVDVVYGNRLLIDENDMEIGRWILPGHDSKVLSWVDYVPQETLFWRRRIWDKAGGYVDESFRFAMDWDLLVRFRDAGAKFAHIPRFLGAFRIHAHQKTTEAINDIGHQEMNRIRERLLGKVPVCAEIRRTVFPFLLKHLAVDIVYRIKTRLRS